MEEPTRGVTGNIIIYGNSQAEKNIRRLKYSTDTINPLKLPSQKGSYEELHPHRIENPDYLSRPPISFWGYFKFGSTTQLSHKDWPKDNYV